MYNKSKIPIFLLLSLIFLFWVFLFSDNIVFKTVYSQAYRNINYNSSSSDPELSKVKEFFENNDGSEFFKELKISFKMKAKDTIYDNVFQTASGDQGLRMELYSEPGKHAKLFLYLGGEDGKSTGYLLFNRVKTGRWYSVNLIIYKNKRISVFVNGLPVFNRREGNINYKISDIAVGTGYSKLRSFQGEIKKFSIEYSLFNKVEGLNYVLIILKLVAFSFFLYFYYLFAAFGCNDKKEPLFQNLGFLRSLLVAALVSYLVYYLFYYFSSFIWLSRRSFPQNELVQTARYGAPDGIESFILYCATFVNVLLVISLDRVLLLFRQKFISFLTLFVFIICSFAYFKSIGFYPPGAAVYEGWFILATFILSVVIIATFLGYLNRKYPGLTNIVVLGLCIPVCFIATAPIAIGDYSYIIAPALRLLHGFKLPEIFFQYDLLLSLLAAIWIKLNINLNSFQIVGQTGIYVFIVGLFLFSKRVFNNKKLPIYLLISLIIARHYALREEPVSILQATPLRLDLWLLILVFVYFKGLYNWTVGLIIGFLVLFHRNFGSIYLVAYLEFIFLLFMLDLVSRLGRDCFSLQMIKDQISKHFNLNKINLFIIFVFILFGAFLFNGFIPRSALMYQSLGIAFLRVSDKSFYWYLPILFSLSALLFLRYRKHLPENYINTGVFLILLAINNSLYFLGRSHEFNIMTLSGIFIFLLFFLLDLLERRLTVADTSSRSYIIKRSIIFSLPVIFLLLVSYYYSSYSIDKIRTQFQNLRNHKFIYPLPVKFDLKTVKEVTNNSQKVYFLSGKDTYYYYYGNYTPLGYFSPFPTWTIKKELVSFLQNLLDNDYYLVIDFTLPVEEILQGLKFNDRIDKNGFSFIWKTDSHQKSR